jgi:DNA-binding transcriptional ArsR family regulator
LEILTYLQSTGSHGSNHSIDFILALYEITLKRKKVDRSNPIISNKDIFTWIREHGGTISNITVQNRKAELTEMGIVTKHRRKRGSGEDIKLTTKGLKIAEAIKSFIDEVVMYRR